MRGSWIWGLLAVAGCGSGDEPKATVTTPPPVPTTPTGLPTGDCVLPVDPGVPSLGPDCDPWLAPEGLRPTGDLALQAGTRIVFGAGTSLWAEADLDALGTAAAPVVLEAAEGERFAGVHVERRGELSHLQLRRVAGVAALATGTTFEQQQPMGTSTVTVRVLSSLTLDGVEIDDVSEGAGLRIDGSASAASPVRFSGVAGPLVTSAGRGLGDPLVEDAGGNTRPWIEVRGAEWLRGFYGTTWGSQAAPIRLVSTVHLESTVYYDCCGYGFIRSEDLTIAPNTVLVEVGTGFEMEGARVVARGVTFAPIDAPGWRGFRATGIVRAYGYDERAAGLVLEDCDVTGAAGPIVDFPVDNLGEGPELIRTHLGPAASPPDVCVSSATTCLDADDPLLGNTLDCATPIVEPARCDGTPGDSGGSGA